MGGRIFSLRWKDGDVELMHVDDLIRVLNYMPCHCGYEFSVDPVWRGRGTTETYEVVERGRTCGLLLRAALEDGLTVETRYGLQGERLCVSHAVTNGGEVAVGISPFTHPEWSYDAFGAQGILEMRESGRHVGDDAAEPGGAARTRPGIRVARSCPPAAGA